MKSSSLLGLALELCASVASPGPYPADARVGRFFRARRFLGSHDRRHLSSVAYGWLRHGHRARARWAAWSEAARFAPGTRAGESTILCELVALARDGLIPWTLAGILQAEGDRRQHIESSRASSPLSTFGIGGDALLARVLAEPTSAEALLDGGCWPADPTERVAAESSLPQWLARRLIDQRGGEAGARLARALLEPASVDLRVNLAKVDRETARRELAREIEAPVIATPWSPLGLRLDARRPLSGTYAWKQGWIEIEDEGSQIVALSLDASPGEVIIDACAGGGGKTLALADLLRCPEAEVSSGHRGSSVLFALDMAPERLARLEQRARRAAAAECIRTIALSPSGDAPPEVPEADLVLIDAPCSGLGTLRRSPDVKWRYGPDELQRFQQVQRSLLERWQLRVKRGGRLAYGTCSILEEENEAVARPFAETHPEFETYVSAWAQAQLPRECRVGDFLRLDPAMTGTDGFFLAMWTRR